MINCYFVNAVAMLGASLAVLLVVSVGSTHARVQWPNELMDYYQHLWHTQMHLVVLELGWSHVVHGRNETGALVATA